MCTWCYHCMRFPAFIGMSGTNEMLSAIHISTTKCVWVHAVHAQWCSQLLVNPAPHDNFFTRVAHLLNHAMIFFNEIIEYITNEKPARFKIKIYNSNYRRNILPIFFKYIFIRSELKLKPMKIQCVFLKRWNTCNGNKC